MFHWKRKSFLPVVIVLAVLSTACGGQPNQQTTPNYSASNPSSGTGTTGTSTSSGTIKPPSTASNGQTDTTEQGTPILTTDFQVLGTKGLSQTNPGGSHQFTITDIATDNLLRISLTAASPGSITDTGYQIPFNCIKFSVKVGNSYQTALVSTTGSDISGGTCNGAKAEPILKFDSEARPGHGNLTAVLIPISFDNCIQQYDPYYGMGRYWAAGCTLNSIPTTHMISGTVTVYVNGSDS
jgi:hypothetical protein